jgi:hypothetical protein
METGNYAICQSCGKKADYTECSQNCAVHDAAYCVVLSGWFQFLIGKGQALLITSTFAPIRVFTSGWIIG